MMELAIIFISELFNFFVFCVLFAIFYNLMKILKIYDKLNRNILQVEGASINIKEYLSDNNFIHLIINTKLFSLKNEKMSYMSYVNTIDGLSREIVDITSKYIQHKLMDEKGRLIHSKRIHIKDSKSFLEINRIYDDGDNFIEIENYKGNKNLTFELKNEIITNLLNK